jgi:tRNA pseudouridine55 synthase
LVPHAPTSGRVQLMEQSTDGSTKSFIGVGEILDDGRVAPRRLVLAR